MTEVASDQSDDSTKTGCVDFYNSLADGYDNMTRFQSRLLTEKGVMDQWVRRFEIKSAIDAACGTGLHAVVLAQLGVISVGVDLSASMLEQARSNAVAQNAEVVWVQASLETMAGQIGGNRDAVFCLGNSIPHLLSKASLDAALKGFLRLLKNGGIAVIQLLNYERILEEKNRIVGVSRVRDTEYVRFYDFCDNMIEFNVLTINWDREKVEHSLTSTELYPYRADELTEAVRNAGFSEVRTHGDMHFADYVPNKSDDLVVVAVK
jgi:glycine/sarcosine N-methyltransferase